MTEPEQPWVLLEGERCPLIRYGDERDEEGRPWFTTPCHLCGAAPGEVHTRSCGMGDGRNDWMPTCRDCGVPLGTHHVLMCGIERCPRCNGQYVSCDCEGSEDGPGDEDCDSADGSAAT